MGGIGNTGTAVIAITLIVLVFGGLGATGLWVTRNGMTGDAPYVPNDISDEVTIRGGSKRRKGSYKNRKSKKRSKK